MFCYFLLVRFWRSAFYEHNHSKKERKKNEKREKNTTNIHISKNEVKMKPIWQMAWRWLFFFDEIAWTGWMIKLWKAISINHKKNTVTRSKISSYGSERLRCDFDSGASSLTHTHKHIHRKTHRWKITEWTKLWVCEMCLSWHRLFVVFDVVIIGLA